MLSPLSLCAQVKNPRGPISPKRQRNGLVLMTYYNDGGFGAFATHMAVNDRNCMWLTVGHEQVPTAKFIYSYTVDCIVSCSMGNVLCPKPVCVPLDGLCHTEPYS